MSRNVVTTEAAGRGGTRHRPPHLPAVFIIDTREQRPFALDGYETRRATLGAGDYSLAGFEHCVAVERKSHADAWGCVAGSRERFERCLARLAALDRAAIVIECNLRDFAVRPAQVQRVTPATAVGSFVSWSVQFGIPVFWCDNRRYAERITVRYLLSYLKHRGGPTNGDSHLA